MMVLGMILILGTIIFICNIPNIFFKKEYLEKDIFKQYKCLFKLYCNECKHYIPEGGYIDPDSHNGIVWDAECKKGV
jgi:hypothetical protein